MAETGTDEVERVDVADADPGQAAAEALPAESLTDRSGGHRDPHADRSPERSDTGSGSPSPTSRDPEGFAVADEEDCVESIAIEPSGLAAGDPVWGDPSLASTGDAIKALRGLVTNQLEWSAAHPGRCERATAVLRNVDAGWGEWDAAWSAIAEAAPRYDACPDSPANGHRSLLRLIELCAKRLIVALRRLESDRGSSRRFRAGVVDGKIEDYSEGLATLGALAKLDAQLLGLCPAPQIFLDQQSGAHRDRMLGEVDQLCTKIFYGKHAGFMYADRTRDCVRLILLAMAQYSIFNRTHGIKPHEAAAVSARAPNSSFLGGAPGSFGAKPGAAAGTAAVALPGAFRCLVNDNARGERITKQIATCGIEFCKGFWNLVETAPMAQHAGKIAGPLLGIAREVLVPVRTANLGCFDLGRLGEAVRGAVRAASGAELRAVQDRVEEMGLSAGERSLLGHIISRREAELSQEGETPKELEPLTHVRCMWYCKEVHAGQNRGFGAGHGSPSSAGAPPAHGLVVHFHGGGFVAQSPRSHEAYLREWATKLRCPILSVDYTLSPEARWPLAVCEGYHAYLWALSNSLGLGSASEKVIISGDSAGGNLAAAVALKAAEAGQRTPDCVVLSYPALRIRMAVGASRLLSSVDALLPLGILRNCLAAYAGSDEPEQHFLLSPNQAPEELLRKVPRWRLVASEFDPLLDDAVEFAHRLRQAGHPDWQLDLAKGCPHGFLSLSNLEERMPAMPGSPTPCHDAALKVLQHIERALGRLDQGRLGTARGSIGGPQPRKLLVRPEAVEGVASPRAGGLLGERPLYVEAEVMGLTQTSPVTDGRILSFGVGDGRITLRLAVRAKSRLSADKRLGVARWELPPAGAPASEHRNSEWVRVRLQLSPPGSEGHEGGQGTPREAAAVGLPVLIVSVRSEVAAGSDSLTAADDSGAAPMPPPPAADDSGSIPMPPPPAADSSAAGEGGGEDELARSAH